MNTVLIIGLVKKSYDFWAKDFDYLHFEKGQKYDKNQMQLNFFLTCLLVLLTSWSCFCFGAVGLTVGLIVGLAISSVVSIALKIILGLLE